MPSSSPPPLSLSFWRAHCGWDSVTLVLADQIPQERARSTAVSLMYPPSSMDSEVGFLKRIDNDKDSTTNNNNTIRLRLIDKVTLDWLPNCGGMTQALGKCLVESPSLRREMKIDVTHPVTEITLVTDTGRVPLLVQVQQQQQDDNPKVSHVWSDMTEFAHYLLKNDGFAEHWLLDGRVQCFTVGYFLIVNGASLSKAFAEYNFWDARAGPHWDDVYNPLCQEYLNTILGHDKAPESGALYTMMYDVETTMAEVGHAGRIATRFYRHDGPPTSIRSTALQCNREAQCGTGTIAVVLALWKSGQLPKIKTTRGKDKDGNGALLALAWGSAETGGDPYPGRTSTVKYKIDETEERLDRIAFSHSCIELLQEGTCYLPTHDLSAWGIPTSLV